MAAFMDIVVLVVVSIVMVWVLVCCCFLLVAVCDCSKNVHENNDLFEGVWEISCQFHGPLPIQLGIFESTAGKRAIRGLY